jgi:nicotinamide-nucleotide amidase
MSASHEPGAGQSGWPPTELASLAEAIAVRLRARGETLAVAETAAGGLIAAALLSVPGASAWFLGGCVAYSAHAKSTWLGLAAGSPALRDGVVSEPAVQAMAAAARAALGATWALAEAGIAGPQTGRRSAKPAGMAWLAVDGPAARTQLLHTGLDSRHANQQAFAAAALRLLLATIPA